jgi:DNA-binding NtrC family response regulator
MSPILIVSGDGEHRRLLSDRIAKSDLRPICCCSASAAKALIGRQPFGAVLSEDPLPDGSFCDLIREKGLLHANSTPVVVVSRRDDWPSFLEALAGGAFDYVAYPPSPGELERAILAALGESERSERAQAL